MGATQSKFPDGWNEEKVRRVIAHYESQTEEEAVAEDTLMSVPHELVPVVPELIAKRR